MINKIDALNFRGISIINGSKKTVCDKCSSVVYSLIKGIDSIEDIKAQYWRNFVKNGKTYNFCDEKCLLEYFKNSKI